MRGNKRWRAALAGSLLLHVGLFEGIRLFWHWDVMQSRQPIYVEVSMADLFAPLDGPAGGGGQPERAPDPVKPQSQPPQASGFSDQVAPQAVAATPAVNGATGSAIGPGGSGTGGSGGGTGGGHGSGKGTGVCPGTGKGTGTTRGPRIVDGGRP